MAIKLRYQTGIATTIQFIALTILYFLHGLSSSVSTCIKGGNCVSNIILSILFFIFVTIGFGVLWMMGFAAQQKRSSLISKILILTELVVLLVGLFDYMHQPLSIINTPINIVEIITAIWIIFLAIRLMRAKGGRVKAIKIHKTHNAN